MTEFRVQAFAGADAPDIDVGAIITPAAEPVATLVFGHGAGADMRHANMAAIADAFAAVGITVVRFNFPFKEAGRSRVDGRPTSTATVAAALDAARSRLDGPFFLGGHSFGGRMASHAVVDKKLDVQGMIFGSFPLHPPKKPSTARADHLDAVPCPMLFLSGSRDGMASHDLMTAVVARLAPKARLEWLDTADHGYKVLKRSRTRDDDVFTEMASHAANFVRMNLG